MKVKVLIPFLGIYGEYSEGKVVDFYDSYALSLIEQGLAEAYEEPAVEEPAPVEEEAAAEASEEQPTEEPEEKATENAGGKSKRGKKASQG